MGKNSKNEKVLGLKKNEFPFVVIYFSIGIISGYLQDLRNGEIEPFIFRISFFLIVFLLVKFFYLDKKS